MPPLKSKSNNNPFKENKVELEILPVKPFDTAALKTRIMSKLGESKKALIDAAKVPLKIVVAEAVDWTVEGCLASESNIVKGLSGVVAGVKKPLLEAIDRA